MFQTVLFRMKKDDHSFQNFEIVNRDKQIKTEEEIYKIVTDFNISNSAFYYVRLEEATPEILLKAFLKKPYQSSTEDMMDNMTEAIRELKSEFEDRIDYIQDMVREIGDDLTKKE